MAEKVMLALVDSGMHRDEAHEVLRSASMASVSENRNLRDVCAENTQISVKFDSDELDALFNPMNHLGVSGELVDEAVAIARNYL